MWSRPEAQDADPGPEPVFVPVFDPDATVEFPAVTDEPPGWRVHGEQSADGWVVIEFIPLSDDELSGEAPDAAPQEGGELIRDAGTRPA
jgi:hypothetical protein